MTTERKKKKTVLVCCFDSWKLFYDRHIAHNFHKILHHSLSVSPLLFTSLVYISFIQLKKWKYTHLSTKLNLIHIPITWAHKLYIGAFSLAFAIVLAFVYTKQIIIYIYVYAHFYFISLFFFDDKNCAHCFFFPLFPLIVFVVFFSLFFSFIDAIVVDWCF